MNMVLNENHKNALKKYQNLSAVQYFLFVKFQLLSTCFTMYVEAEMQVIYLGSTCLMNLLKLT